MDGGHGKRVAGNMEISDCVGGEVRGKTSTGSIALQSIVETNGRRIVQKEMGSRLADEGGCNQGGEESGELSHGFSIVAEVERAWIFGV